MKRQDFEYKKQFSYFELYPATGSPALKNIRQSKDSIIELHLSAVPDQPLNWMISSDDILFKTVNAKEPVFPLQKGVHLYKVWNAVMPDTLFVNAEYMPFLTGMNAEEKSMSGITINNARYPVTDAKTMLEEWSDDEIPISEAEKKMLAELIRDSMHIGLQQTTTEKITSIGEYVGWRLRNAVGYPTDKINSLSVFQQYKSALDTQKLWCGNYAQIFNLFAYAANIKSRMVQISRQYGDIKGNIHIFNEYFDAETGQWAAIDLLYNNIFYRNRTGRLLNAVDLKNAEPGDSSITVYKPVAADTLAAISFSSMPVGFFTNYSRDKDLKFYYRIYPANIFSLKQKFFRFYSPDPWYVIYSDNKIVDNFGFYVKQLFGLLAVIYFLWIVIAFISYYWRKRFRRIL